MGLAGLRSAIRQDVRMRRWRSKTRPARGRRREAWDGRRRPICVRRRPRLRGGPRRPFRNCSPVRAGIVFPLSGADFTPVGMTSASGLRSQGSRCRGDDLAAFSPLRVMKASLHAAGKRPPREYRQPHPSAKSPIGASGPRRHHRLTLSQDSHSSTCEGRTHRRSEALDGLDPKPATSPQGLF